MKLDDDVREEAVNLYGEYWAYGEKVYSFIGLLEGAEDNYYVLINQRDGSAFYISCSATFEDAGFKRLKYNEVPCKECRQDKYEIMDGGLYEYLRCPFCLIELRTYQQLKKKDEVVFH